MPLFFGSSGNGGKPQQLSNKSGSSAAELKDSRGTVVKLQKTTVTIEKKLAEGGFAIIYLVSDKQNRQYALKRQFISDDQRQLEACKRECCIVSCLQGHKNIVRYVDHLISRSRSGIYECSLLTVYYKSSVLQLMNERLLSGRCLSAKEILAIFCDMCEAVARLHHSQTPVIHRDLKVENILIDDGDRTSTPRYVLCDFGSATTKVLSLETHSRQYIEEEVSKYTTLSYRAPEMIDIYAGRPIGTKSDIWAMGVLLYKLCYFQLPFGDSSLAIQNCSFNFPREPEYPDELRAVIKTLLQPDIEKRPDIYQVCCLAFEASGRDSPVGNLNKVCRIPLSEALQLLRKDNTSAQPTRAEVTYKSAAVTGVSTSVNPRLRPKPAVHTMCNVRSTNAVVGETQQGITINSAAQVMQGYIARQNSMSSPDIGSALNAATGSTSVADGSSHLSSYAEARFLGFKDLEDKGTKHETAVCGPSLPFIRRDSKDFSNLSLLQKSATRDAMCMHLSAPQLYPENARANTFPVASNMKPVGIGGLLRSSAFRPYSQTTRKSCVSSKQNEEPEKASLKSDFTFQDASFQVTPSTSKWNPFIGAPFDGITKLTKDSVQYDEDKSFVHFDESDPFGAAPFNGFPASQPSSASSPMLQREHSSDVQELKGCDQADAAEIPEVDDSKKAQFLDDFHHYDEKPDNIYRENEQLQPKEGISVSNPEASASDSDWSSEENGSDSSNSEPVFNLNPTSGIYIDGLCEGALSADAFPSISASSSTAPLLSCSSFSLKSATVPAATSPGTSFYPYKTVPTQNHYAEEPLVLHETNPFASLGIASRDDGKTQIFIPFLLPQPTELSVPTPPAYASCSQSGDPQSLVESRECVGASFPIQAIQMQPRNASAFHEHDLDSHWSPVPAKTLNVASSFSRRCRLLSAESSHSSDDSPQIDESGDKMLLRDSRNKLSHSGGSGKGKKKMTHMEQFAASRANQNISAVDGGNATKHSPALKKQSRKHSGPPVSKRSVVGALDASSFVNTSFQSEDWESHPLSPRPALPQHS